MRNKTIDYIYTKPILDIVDSGYLTVETTNSYQNKTYLHDGVITFSSVFPELVDSWIKVEKVILLEQIRGTGNLVKPSCNLLLFPKCKSQPTITRRNSFQYSDIFDDTYPLENQLTPISISSSNWTFEHTVPNIADAMAIVDLTSQAIHFKSDGTQNLFGVLVTTQITNAFASSVKFKVRLIVSLL